MAHKSTYAKVYTPSGSYLTTWSDIADGTVSYSQEINSAGSQMVIGLARPADNFGEGSDVTFNNQVDVYISDLEAPTGRLIFSGFIADYTPQYASTERITVTVLGYGAELDEYLIQPAGDISTGTVEYLSMDPSNILKDILDNYQLAGGTITYTPSSIDLTNTTVSYTFNTNTVLEGVKKCLELAPSGWYFYIDQATNVLHFHKKEPNAQVSFTLGKDIISLSAEKRTEQIVNVLYFSGGEVTPGVNLFKYYVNSVSLTAYGRHQRIYTDNRVTLDSTADIIAQGILDTYAAPEVRTRIEVADSNMIASAGGYDIESLVVGMVVGFSNVSGVGATYWDQARWDVDVWDFNAYQLGSLSLQVARLDYKLGSVTLTLSTVPPDVNKRIEDIKRQVQAEQTAYNPSIAT